MPRYNFSLTGSNNTTEVDVYIGDDPDRYPANDCGHNVSLHIVRFMANGCEDYCTLGWISRDGFARRIAEWMSQRGVHMEFPNGITTEEFQRLERVPFYVEAAKAVLAQFARSGGLDIPPMVFLGSFPFDAFIEP
jgi:hypothetical protein